MEWATSPRRTTDGVSMERTDGAVKSRYLWHGLWDKSGDVSVLMQTESGFDLHV